MCSFATYTDFKYGKVFNKHITKFLLIGILVDIVYFCFAIIQKQIIAQILLRYIINNLICCGISFFMHFNKSWGAGDAKLYFTIVFLMPYNLFVDNSLNLFPGFVLLVLIFGISFMYLIVETIILLFKDFRRKNISWKFWRINGYNRQTLFDLIFSFIFSYFLCSIIIKLSIYYVPNIFINNRGLYMFLNVLLITISLSFLRDRKMLYAVIVVMLLYVGIHIFIIPASKSIFTANISSIITFIIVIFLRYLGSKYNYKEILTENIRAGMVLSFDTVIKFKSSRIKGLPEFTTESTDTRIPFERIESIKRWGKSNPLNSTIRIVKHIPFAPFISFGTILFLLLRLYMILLGQGR